MTTIHAKGISRRAGCAGRRYWVPLRRCQGVFGPRWRGRRQPLAPPRWMRRWRRWVTHRRCTRASSLRRLILPRTVPCAHPGGSRFQALPNVSKVSVLVEMNPNPLAASFDIPPGTEVYIETRVKVAQTCTLYAVAEADGQLYMQSRETKVTLGGCGS